MKKIFLVTGIAAFSFASAQNTTDTFWIKPLMSAPGTNSFQLPNTSPFNYTPRLHHLSPSHRQGLDRAKLLYTLTNGGKVYALPQDNMPCLVPDLSQYNMPVMKPGVIYTIPNPAYPPATTDPTESEKKRQQFREYFDTVSKNGYRVYFK
jgi:hypothetical protein